MKHVVYYHNGVEGEEELHEDEEVAKLVKGEVVERASEYLENHPNFTRRLESASRSPSIS
jgi:hypothetical protein